MPPFLPRKHLRTPSPEAPQKRAASSSKTKRDIFTTFDNHTKAAPSAAENKAFLDALSDEQSSLSEADSDDFEDVLPTPAPKRQKIAQTKHADSDDELEFEDVGATEKEEEYVIPEISEDLNVTVRDPGDVEHTRLTLKQGGKAPITKKMRAARIASHCMHVQFLLWHNVIRNCWINDSEVQLILLKGLPDALKAEVTKWKIATGLERPEKKSKGKKGSKGKSASRFARDRIRDWGAEAQRSKQNGQINPLLRLLKYLAAYWKKRFRVTAPSLRKLGYCNPREMREEMDSFNEGPHDPSRHGERITDLDDFREAAKKCQGSRDVGAQLFTALLRGLGIEARMVVSLQPTGYGWSKNEEAGPRKAQSVPTTATATPEPKAVKHVSKQSAKKAFSRSSTKGTNLRPISLDSDDDHDSSSSSLSSPPSSELDDEAETSAAAKATPAQRFDRDLLYPTYWTEVLSPASNTYIPVSTMLHPNVITQPQHMVNFEPRGAAAEKAKQVMCYVVAFSADGTAKDVTVRYLRKRQWPGRTKGLRMPVEKFPVYNHNGKVIKHEDYDWFKRVMRGYVRPGDKRTIADDIEDEGDLVPVRPEGDEKKKADPETLQGYKQSAIFVLERHLRREEALLPGAKPIKYFHVGKGDKATKEPVYKRADIVIAKTVETWHKEGREVKVGEQALKQVAYRAVTLLRKREIEDQARDMGQKPTQGLYAEYQTDWIIPDPIGPDRSIPKNVFGNIDVYVPSMVPKGAIHIPLKGTVRVCKRLGIDFAEACTGFEFGKQRAVPVITGVVVAEENEDLVIDAWEADEEIRREKESKKREELLLGLWKKFVRGMRIRERMRKEYGETGVGRDGAEERQWAGKGKGLFGMGREVADEEMGEDGFLRDDDEEVEGGGFLRDEDEGGGFLPESEDDAEPGGFEIIGGSQDVKNRRSFAHLDTDQPGGHDYMRTPISLQAMHAEMVVATGEDDESASNEAHAHDDDDEKLASDDGNHGTKSDESDVKPAPRPKSGRRGHTSQNKSLTKQKTKPSKTSRKTRSRRIAAATSSPYFSH